MNGSSIERQSTIPAVAPSAVGNEPAVTISDTSQGAAFMLGEVAKSIIPEDFLSESNYTNPDKIVRAKGMKVFEQMLLDDLIGPISQLKKLIILAFDWRVKPFDDSLEAARRADFTNHVLTETLNRSFFKVMYDILDAHFFGFSFSEINWAYIRQGEYAGKVGLKSIKPKPQDTINFKVDQFGNINLVTQKVNASESPLPKEKFIHHVVNQRNENPYGQSSLTRIYNIWFIKTILMRLYPAHVERHGSPTIEASFPASFSDQLRRQIESVVRTMQFSTSIVHRDDMKFNFLEVPPATAYPEAISLMNKFISRGLGVPDLFGFTDVQMGTRNLGLAHFDLVFLLSDSERNDLLETLNYQLIPRIEDVNFPAIGRYSTIEVTKKRLGDAKAVADLFAVAVKQGGVNPTLRADINKLRSAIGLDQIAENEFDEYLASVKPYVVTGAKNEEVIPGYPSVSSRIQHQPPQDPPPGGAPQLGHRHDHEEEPGAAAEGGGSVPKREEVAGAPPLPADSDPETINRNVDEVNANLSDVKRIVYDGMNQMTDDVLRLALAAWDAGDIDIQGKMMETSGYKDLRKRIETIYSQSYLNGEGSATKDLEAKP